MEGKTLPKGKGEKELSLDKKILEIEKAYSDLMKAYSSCITALKLKKMVWYKTFFPKNLMSTEALLKGNILAPRFIKRNIRKQVDLLRGAFLLLITQNRNKIDPEIINRFELYYEDMNKLSTQFEKSGLIAIFYAAIPIIPIITGVAAVAVQIKPVSLEFSLGQLLICVIIIAIIGYLFYFFIVFLVLGFLGSRRLFREADVSEKEKKIFALIQECLEFV